MKHDKNYFHTLLAESRSKRQRARNVSISVSVVDETKSATLGGTSKCPSLQKLPHQTSSTDSQEDNSSQGPEPQPSLVSVVRKRKLCSFMSVSPSSPTVVILETVDCFS
jgi:hypothetical protein